jgi:hypothetical protein
LVTAPRFRDFAVAHCSDGQRRGPLELHGLRTVKSFTVAYDLRLPKVSATGAPQCLSRRTPGVQAVPVFALPAASLNITLAVAAVETMPRTL